jgi:hypothetical protein
VKPIGFSPMLPFFHAPIYFPVIFFLPIFSLFPSLTQEKILENATFDPQVSWALITE